MYIIIICFAYRRIVRVRRTDKGGGEIGVVQVYMRIYMIHNLYVRGRSQFYEDGKPECFSEEGVDLESQKPMLKCMRPLLGLNRP